MLRTRLIIALLAAVLVTGCATGKRTTKLSDADGNGTYEQRVTNTDNLSQRTLRFQDRTTLATALCTLQSNNASDPENRIIAVVGETKIYSQTIIVFDMPGCIAEALRWGGERLLMTAINKTADLLNLGIKGYAAVSIAKRVFDNQGVKITNVEAGATVGVGTDQAPVNIDQRSDRAGDGSTYNTCAGEFVEGECVLPAVADTAEDELDEFCGIPDDCSGEESYLAGSCGDIDPEIVACLSEG